MFLENYLSVFIFLSSSIVLSSIVFGLSFVLSPKMDDREKLTAYECGFSPFEDSKEHPRERPREHHTEHPRERPRQNLTIFIGFL